MTTALSSLAEKNWPPGAGAWVRPHRLVLALVYCAALGAAYVMLPGQNQRIAMLERDGHTREAMTILEQSQANGDTTYQTQTQLLNLYENEGQLDKFRTVLSGLIKDNPRDVTLINRQIQFALATQDDDSYVSALKMLLDVKYSEAACRDLIGKLRLSGDFDGETAALQNCRQKGYRRPEDLLRLAGLLASAGEKSQASAILRSIDDVKRLKGQGDRFTLAGLLLEQDQPKEAERRALRWIRASKDDDAFAVALIDVFAQSKYPNSAIEVAKDAGSPGDPVSLTIAERLIEQGQAGPARLYLASWLERASFTGSDTVQRFAEAALLADDPEIAYRGGRQAGLEILPVPVLERLAAALDARDLIGDAAEVRAAARRAPVVAPPVNSAEGGSPAAGNAGVAPPAAGTPGQSAAGGGPVQRRVLLSDPLDTWKRSLASRMQADAERRLHAQAIGPPVPIRHGLGARDVRPELHNAGTKFLKKTSKVFQRAKKNRYLRNRGKLLKEQGGSQFLKAPVP